MRSSRGALAWAGRKAALVVAVIFFAGAALAVLASVGYALPQSSPISAPIVVEGRTQSGGRRAVQRVIEMIEVRDIASEFDIPPEERFVLLRHREENKEFWHSRGVTIFLERNESPGGPSQLEFVGALTRAKFLADREGISAIYMMRELAKR